jgi:hypothetical protein
MIRFTITRASALGLFGALALAGLGRGDEPRATPLPVPLTRPEMKQALEDLKGRKPRIPLPALSPEEEEELGPRAYNYEGRLRYHYFPGTDARGGFSRDPDPNMTLDYAFKTELFWIVSRINNCHY